MALEGDFVLQTKKISSLLEPQSWGKSQSTVVNPQCCRITKSVELIAWCESILMKESDTSELGSIYREGFEPIMNSLPILWVSFVGWKRLLALSCLKTSERPLAKGIQYSLWPFSTSYTTPRLISQRLIDPCVPWNINYRVETVRFC